MVAVFVRAGCVKRSKLWADGEGEHKTQSTLDAVLKTLVSIIKQNIRSFDGFS